MATLTLLSWATQTEFESNRAFKPANVQVPWQSRSANPALVREQQSCVVRSWLQCLWGHHHKPENYGEGSIRALQCGKLQRLPKLRTGGISCKQEFSAAGTGPGREMSLGTNSWSGRIELLKSWNHGFQKIFCRLTHVMNAHRLRMDFLQKGMGNEVSHWQSMSESSVFTKVLKCPNI